MDVRQEQVTGSASINSLLASPILSLTTENIEQALSLPILLLLDFWAPWCQPCRQLEPIIRQVQARYAAHLVIAKVNVDMQQEIARRFAVRSIPSLVLLQEQQEILRLVAGEYTYPQLIAELDPYVPDFYPESDAMASAPS